MLVICGQDRKDTRKHEVKREEFSQQAGLGRSSAGTLMCCNGQIFSEPGRGSECPWPAQIHSLT